MTMRVLSVVGARPQFVKAALLSAEFARQGMEEVLVHTGQHYDPSMSDVFFSELELPEPRYRLGVGSANHGAQTGEMMKRLEAVVLAEKPDSIVVYGDTNTTLAGALVGSKLTIPTAHVEAGLRSFNRAMPEEINRVVADHVCDLLFAPSLHAAQQLASEGVTKGVHVVGDLMIDLVVNVARTLPARPAILDRFGVQPRAYGVATIHRAANTDDHSRFAQLIEGLRRIDMPIVFAVHPRTQALATAHGVGTGDNIIVSAPLSYGEMIALMSRAAMIFTDSGGMQKEAFALRVPCTTLREETEWLDTLEDGWNALAGCDPAKIVASVRRVMPMRQNKPLAAGDAARQIVTVLQRHPTVAEMALA